MQATAQRGTRLTPEQAEALWRAWKVKKDVRARDRLVLSYAPMVKFLASRKVRELPAHFEMDDLVSCGFVALIESIDRFDPAKGAPLEHYAWTRVSGAIMDELRRQDWAPRSLRRFERAADRAADELHAKNGRTATEDELAQALGMAVSDLREKREELEKVEVTSLNAPARGSDESLPIEVGDTIEGGIGQDPETALLAGERNERFREAIAALGDRERRVLTLLHVHQLSGAEISEILGVTESRVSQILGAIRKKLRDHLDRYEETAAAA